MIALSTASLYKEDLKTVFEWAKEIGFEGIELNIDYRPETQDKKLLYKLKETYQFPIVSIHVPCNFRHRRLWGRGMRIKIEKSTEIAKFLGTPIIVTHVPILWQFEYVHWLSVDLNAFEKEKGIVIAIENIGLTPILGFKFNLHWYNRLEALSRFSNLTLDTSHLGSLEIDISRAYKLLQYKIKHIHLSNYSNGIEHCLLTSEGLPIKEFLEYLSNATYRGAIVLEFSPYSLGYPDLKKVKMNLHQNLEFCHKYFR